MKPLITRRITVTLAGNPNVGKSTLFNALTGLHQHTGNWPGKTVGLARGVCRRDNVEWVFTDLPGTYALSGSSEDEQIAAEYLCQNTADCTVVVCDGSCLSRSLILALEILQNDGQVVLCVNLMDEANLHGIGVNPETLSSLLGIPVVLTAAEDPSGLERLLRVICETAGGMPQAHIPFSDPIVSAEEIAKACTYRKGVDRTQWHRKVEKLLVSRRFGFGLLALTLFLILWLTVWGANYPSAALSFLFDRIYLLLNNWLSFLPDWLRGLLLDGCYTTCARVIAVMLPPMAIFFPLFTLLEDIGYLPRMAFLLDPAMARCGGCGKQALTLCMGLGCNAVGILGCRILDSPRERTAAILTNAMVPCNGRFPTLILLGSLFFPQLGAAMVVAACVALGVTGAMAVSGVLSKTVLRSKPSSFLMELPPFRRPRLGKILVRSLLHRTLAMAARTAKVAAPCGAVLWILANTGSLTMLTHFLEPAGNILGMNGAFLLGFLFCLPANELLFPVVLMAITSAGSIGAAALMDSSLLLHAGVTWQMAICVMVFTLFHWPCATTLMTIRRETHSFRLTAAAAILPTLVGIILCMLLKLLLML